MPLDPGTITALCTPGFRLSSAALRPEAAEAYATALEGLGRSTEGLEILLVAGP